MVTATQIVAMALACVVLIAVPGPSVMFVVGRALTHGRSSALASVAGNAVGCYMVGAVIALGFGTVLERSEIVFNTIKWVGIAYLFWLGIHALRYARFSAEPSTELARTESISGSARAGIVVGLTNPKSFVLFTAIVPQFIDPEAGNVPLQILLLGVVPLFIGLATDTSWALLAGRARTWLTKSPSSIVTFGRIGGLSIIGVGVSVAMSGDGP
ncbi:threonine/homoserine/homoserine lactone efflux protein [Rhodococcus sp. OAS809]|uniref:LysE family translocator n=1 Tax=Rhodococcus sp. OAS809 TaxID=2663874 RepID=UPI0017899AFA